jgi:hypothetical protein
MKTKNILQVLLIPFLAESGLGFMALAGMKRPVNRQTLRPPNSSRDEEIAKLEEQLARLKEEQLTEQSTDISTKELNGEINAVEKRLLENVQGKDMILSEKELFDGNIVEDQSTEGNVLSNLLIAVGALVFLTLFSQIPIGQEDFSKYSVAPTSASRTIDLGDLNLNTDVPRP